MKRLLNTELDRDMCIAYIKRLDIGKKYMIEVVEKKAQRTISQNNLYWLFLTCIEFETGNGRDDLHEYFKEMFLTPEPIELFGKKRLRRSTKNLNKTQFKYYLDQIQIFTNTELAITLPNPEDHYWDEFYQYYVDKL